MAKAKDKLFLVSANVIFNYGFSARTRNLTRLVYALTEDEAIQKFKYNFQYNAPSDTVIKFDLCEAYEAF
jgi:hypothetical protein